MIAQLETHQSAAASTITHELKELAEYIRQILPQSKSITELETHELMEAVTFQWQGRRFLVRRNLEALELRRQQLFVTGASVLLQTGLRKRDKHDKVLTAILDLVKQAEEMISSKRGVESGLKLLATAKSSLQRLLSSTNQVSCAQRLN